MSVVNRTDKQVWASGIGGRKRANEFTTMPFQAQWGAATDQFDLYAIKPPNGVDILMGLDIQDVLGTVIDRERSTVSCLFHKLNIKTEPSAIVTKQLQQAPLTVVATNSGCNFVYAAVRNSGLRVDSWYSIEKDPVCRKMSDHHRCVQRNTRIILQRFSGARQYVIRVLIRVVKIIRVVTKNNTRISAT